MGLKVGPPVGRVREQLPHRIRGAFHARRTVLVVGIAAIDAVAVTGAAAAIADAKGQRGAWADEGAQQGQETTQLGRIGELRRHQASGPRVEGVLAVELQARP